MCARTPAPSCRDYDLGIFDFDGTLADSFGFFLRVHDHLAVRHGFRGIDPEEIENLRDLSPRELMRRSGLPRWKLPMVARDFARLMRGADIRLFNGVEDALQRLRGQGITIALVSSNTRDNCRRVVGETHWRKLAHAECGASIFGKRRRIARVLRATGIPPRRAIYVGDQSTDAEAAHAAGVAFGAVGWGYATLSSLKRAGATLLMSEVADLATLGGANADETGRVDDA